MAASTHLTCSICLKKLKSCRLGKPEPCHHMFCFTCIYEWAKNVNTCPVDRIKFNTIEVFGSLAGDCVEKVYVPDQTVDDEPLDLTHCEVCRDHHREHELLLCDGCDKGYHLNCLTPPLSEVPEDDWYCPNCQPIIDAQYYYDFSSSEEDTVTEWDSSSGSDVDITSRHRPINGLIADSSESQSDSDVEELRTNRIVQNICSVGEPRILISESSESESETTRIDPKESIVDVETLDDSPAPLSSAGTSKHCSNNTLSYSAAMSRPGGSYVDLLRQFSKQKASKKSTLSSGKKGVSSRKNSLPETRQPQASLPRLSLKPFSVIVSPLQHGVARGLPASTLSTAPLPSTSTPHSTPTINRIMPTTNRKSRGRKRRVRLSLKKQRKSKRKRRRQNYRNDKPYYNNTHTDTSAVSHPVRTRSKARTVASYTPQQLTFRAAVRESYRHNDLDAGLENARKIILESGNAFRHTPLNTPIKIPTPQSGYMGKDTVRVPLRERIASEVKRRSVPEAKKCLPLDLRNCKPTTTPIHVSATPCPQRTDSELLEKICQDLDDLKNTRNIIQRDGTIIPLRDDSLEPVSPVRSFPPKERPLNGSGPAHYSQYHFHQLSLPQQGIDNTENMYDSSECELVIDDEFADSKENIETEPRPKHDSLASNKPFLDSISPCPLIPLDEVPSTSADHTNTLIDVSCMSNIRSFVMAELDHYHSEGEISSRQYHRILERATQKVMKGKTTTLDRVKKLVLDFVNLYKLSC